MIINNARRRFVAASLALPAYSIYSRLGLAADQTQRSTLSIPELYSGDLHQGIRHFQLRAQAASKSFFPGIETATLAYNGDYLGPALHVKSGEKVAFDVSNQLAEETTVHWHGMVLPARMDGGPHQTIPAGAQWRSQFDVIQKAATLY